MTVPCSQCARELDLENVHDDDGVPKCFEHCSLCRAELDGDEAS